MNSVTSPTPGGTTGAGRLKVYVRIRPTLPGELSNGAYNCLLHEEGSGNWIQLRRVNPAEEEAARKSKPKMPLTNSDDDEPPPDEEGLEARLHFTRVWGPTSSGDEIFRSVGVSTVDDVFEGFHGCIMVYGQTATGKTFTLGGPEAVAREKTAIAVESAPFGLLPLCMKYIFEKKKRLAATQDIVVRHQYIQVHRDMVFDLLKQGKEGVTELPLRVDEVVGAVVDGAVTRESNSYEETMRTVREGDNNRVVANTKLNTHSSRSHACFITDIFRRKKTAETSASDESESPKKKEAVIYSRLFLVDLAGSERVKRSGAEGEAYKDAVAINKSLTALGSCINALANEKKVNSFRESKLTRLLQFPISGNGTMHIIVTVTPDSRCVGETISTLQFARRAQKIESQMTASDFLKLTVETQNRMQEVDEGLADLVLRANVCRQFIDHASIDVYKRQAEVQAMEKGLQQEIDSIFEESNRAKKELEETWKREEREVQTAFLEEKAIITDANAAHVADVERRVHLGTASTIRDCQQKERLMYEKVKAYTHEVELQRARLDKYETDLTEGNTESLELKVTRMKEQLSEDIEFVKQRIKKCRLSPNEGKSLEEIKELLAKARATIMPLHEKRQRLLRQVKGWDLSDLRNKFRLPTHVELMGYADHVREEIKTFPLTTGEGSKAGEDSESDPPSSSLPSSWFETESSEKSSSRTGSGSSLDRSTAESGTLTATSAEDDETDNDSQDFFQRTEQWKRSPPRATGRPEYGVQLDDSDVEDGRPAVRVFFDRMEREEKEMVDMRDQLKKYLAGKGTFVYLVTPPGPSKKISGGASAGSESPTKKKKGKGGADGSLTDFLVTPTREEPVITRCVCRLEGDRESCRLYLRSAEEGAKSSYIVEIPLVKLAEILLGQDSESFQAAVENCASVPFGARVPKTTEKISVPGLRLFFYRSLTLTFKSPIPGVSSGPDVTSLNLIFNSDADFESWCVAFLFSLEKEPIWSAPLDLTGCGAILNDLTLEERAACELHHVQPDTFLRCRETLLTMRDEERLMYVTPMLLRKVGGIDLLHAFKLLSFLSLNGDVEVVQVQYIAYRDWLAAQKKKEEENELVQDLRKRIIRMIRAYRPTPNSVIQLFLKKCAGKERATLNQMVEEYGPEPDSDDDEDFDEEEEDDSDEEEEDEEDEESELGHLSRAEKAIRKQRERTKKIEDEILLSEATYEKHYFSPYMQQMIAKAAQAQLNPSAVLSSFDPNSLAAKVENVRRSLLCNEQLQAKFAHFVEPDGVQESHLLHCPRHFLPVFDVVDQFVNGLSLVQRGREGTVKASARRQEEVLLITGLEGSGKSLLALFMFQYYLCGVDLKGINNYLLLSSTTSLTLSSTTLYTIPESPGKCAFIPVYIRLASIHNPMGKLLEEGLSNFLGIDLTTAEEDLKASNSGVISLSALQERVPFLFIIDGVDEIRDKLLVEAEAYPTPGGIPSTSHVDKYIALMRLYNAGMLEEEIANAGIDGDVSDDDSSSESSDEDKGKQEGDKESKKKKDKIQKRVSTARLFGVNNMHKWVRSKFIFTARHLPQTESNATHFYSFLQKFVAPAARGNPALPDLDRLGSLILCPLTETRQKQFILRNLRLVSRNMELFGEGFNGVYRIIGEMQKLSRWYLYMSSPELLHLFISVIPHILPKLAITPDAYTDKINLLKLIELHVEKETQLKLESLGLSGVPPSLRSKDPRLLLAVFAYDSALTMAGRGTSSLTINSAVGGRPVDPAKPDEDPNAKKQSPKKVPAVGIRQEQVRTTFIHQSSELLFYRYIGPFLRSPLFNPLPLQNHFKHLGTSTFPWMAFSDDVVFESRLMQSYYLALIMSKQLAANPLDENNIINRVSFVRDEQLMSLVYFNVGQEALMELVHLVKKRLLTKKKEGRLHVAVMNALSTLVFHNVPFSKFDFNGMNLSYSNLRYGLFDYASFEDANLTGAIIRGAQFNFSMLAGIKLRDATLKEWAPVKDTEQLTALAWSPNDKYVAVAGFNNVISFFEAGTARFTGIELEGHEDCVTTICISRDGLTLVSGSEDETVRIWDAQNGDLLKVLEGHEAAINCVAISPDSRTVASASEDETIILWDAESGLKLGLLEGHDGPVICVAFSPSGRSVVTGGEDTRAMVWDLESLQLLSYFGSHEGAITAVAISPSGALLATASEDRSIGLYDKSGEEVHKLLGHSGTVSSVHFCPSNETFLCSASIDRTVRIWDARRGDALRVFYSHVHEARRAMFNSDGSIIASVGCDCMCRFHDVNLDSVSCLSSEAEIPEPILYTSVLDSRRIISVSVSRVTVWDIDKSECLMRYLSPQTIVCATVPGETIEDTASEASTAVTATTQTMSTRGNEQTSPVKKAPPPKKPRVILGCNDGVIRVIEQTALESVSASLVGTAGGHESAVVSLHSTSSESFVSSSTDATVKLWDFDPKEFKKEYGTVALPLMSIDTPDPVSILRASLDGSFLVAACKDKRIRKIRARDGKVIAEFAGHKSIVTAIELSEDSELLVSGANDCVIKVWHTDNAKEMRSLKGHLGAITALVITGDTQEIFSGSMDQSIRVWDVASAEQTHYIPSHQVASLAVSADMKVIVSGGFDGVVRVIKKFEMVWCTMRLLGPRSLTTANAFGVVGLAELKEATKPVKYFLQNAKGGISTPKPPEDGEAEEEG